MLVRYARHDHLPGYCLLPSHGLLSGHGLVGPMNAPSSTTSRQLIWGLVVVLSAWGIYLAVGATGVFTDVGLFNAWRSLIVLACSGVFLVGWMWALRGRPTKSECSAEATPQTRWNIACLLSLLFTGGMIAAWSGSWVAWTAGNPNATFVLGGVAAALAAVASILALIGLSDRRRERGKLWGLLTLFLLFLATIAFVVQVRNYAARSSTRTAESRTSPRQAFR